MTHTFEFDPAEVLEIPGHSALEQIRDAYRAKSKKHHPDLGGDEWAFRVVVRAYELMSQARVAGYLDSFHSPDPEPVRRAPTYSNNTHAAGPDDEGVSVRRGVRDNVADPLRLVDAELLILRLELENPYEVISLQDQQRNLSCSLSVSWPSSQSPPESAHRRNQAEGARILAGVSNAFTATIERTSPRSSWRDVEDGRFSGLLGFPTARATSEALVQLRAFLKQAELGIAQWTREVVIPRDRR